MKVAILGAGGAVGARIIESFQLGDGPSTTAVVSEPCHLGPAARFPLELRVADVFDGSSLARSFAGCSAAVHTLPLAASELKRSVIAFCRAGAQAGLRRLIYISSAEVYGLNPRSGTTEDSPLHGRHASARVNALVAADQKFSAECRRLGLDSVVLRPGLIYGPRSGWLAGVIAELAEDRVRLAQDGDGICNCVYVDHVVDATRLALKTKTVAGPAFIITDEETVTWREFYQAIADELAAPTIPVYVAAVPAGVSASPFEATEGSPPDTIARQQCRLKLSSLRARRDLGLRSVVSFGEAIQRSAAWWRFAHGDFAAA
jgi:nucleoside-diphosphate-sugar epimerase